jgi:hypothetical protein
MEWGGCGAHPYIPTNVLGHSAIFSKRQEGLTYAADSARDTIISKIGTLVNKRAARKVYIPHGEGKRQV